MIILKVLSEKKWQHLHLWKKNEEKRNFDCLLFWKKNYGFRFLFRIYSCFFFLFPSHVSIINLFRIGNCVENDSMCLWTMCEPDVQEMLRTNCDGNAILPGISQNICLVPVVPPKALASMIMISLSQRHFALHSRKLDLLLLKKEKQIINLNLISISFLRCNFYFN